MCEEWLPDSRAVLLPSVRSLAYRLRRTHTTLTSRLKIRSCSRLITLVIVPSVPPEALSGLAKSILLPLRKSPLASKRLLRYADAVCRLCGSILQLFVSMYSLWLKFFFWEVNNEGGEIGVGQSANAHVQITLRRLMPLDLPCIGVKLIGTCLRVFLAIRAVNSDNHRSHFRSHKKRNQREQHHLSVCFERLDPLSDSFSKWKLFGILLFCTKR